MKRVILILATVLALALAGTATAEPPAKRIARAAGSGQFSVAAVNATVTNPYKLWLRLSGKITAGTAVVACSRGYAVISSNSYTHNRAGTYRLPIRPSRADSCVLVASAGGEGRIVVELYASRT